MIKATESFEIESKARRVLKEMVDHYEERIENINKKFTKASKSVKDCTDKFAMFESSIKQLKQEVTEIPAIKGLICAESALRE